jgi:hypothetical protein
LSTRCAQVPSHNAKEQGGASKAAKIQRIYPWRDVINNYATWEDAFASNWEVELARRLGVTQAAISRIEQPHDLLLSTLNSYLGAIGGPLTVSGETGVERGLPVPRPGTVSTQMAPS